MVQAPLEDPTYNPLHPPIDGFAPDVVEKWGPRSQLRWFERFVGDMKPRPSADWDRFYCDSLDHRGLCCVSCIADKEDGYGDDIEGCCCKRLWDDATQTTS